MTTHTKLNILHFNDVYNIEEGDRTEPVGGAFRFVTAIQSFRSIDPLVFFSGDIFAPSMLSTFTKGEHMIPVLNRAAPHCAVFGNHDFDHGLEQLDKLTSMCEFPWLMSNIVDDRTGTPLGNGKVSHTIIHGGIKLGLIGLVEKEWLETLSTVNLNEVTFMDFVETATNLGASLRKEGCDIIIALTHMRTPNDIKLAEHCDEVDLILGGHDHISLCSFVNNKYIIKSGSDFRTFSKITLNIDELKKLNVETEIIEVTSDYEENPNLIEELKPFTDILKDKMTQILCKFSVPLVGMFEIIRRNETNLADFICDVVLYSTESDVAIINAGTFRSDRIHSPGDFTMKDLYDILPSRNALVTLSCSGRTLIEALENGVSKYPKMEGRFPQVSGFEFTFDPSKPAGERLIRSSIKIKDEEIQYDKLYRVTIKKYIHLGCDGYTMFKDCTVLLDEDMCPQIGMALYDFLTKAKEDPSVLKHIQSLIHENEVAQINNGILAPKTNGRIKTINSVI